MESSRKQEPKVKNSFKHFLEAFLIEKALRVSSDHSGDSDDQEPKKHSAMCLCRQNRN